MSVVRDLNHDHLRGHDRCKGDLANPAILVTVSHHSNTHRKAFKISGRLGASDRAARALSVCAQGGPHEKGPLAALCRLNLYTAHWNAWHARGVALWPLNRPWPPLSLSFCQLVKH